jgi:hypothetical protein
VNKFRRILAFLASLWIIHPPLSAVQLPAGDNVLDKYSVVLDSVFPVDWEQCKLSRASFLGSPQITIRILPSFFLESQVFICQIDPGQFFIVSSTLNEKEGSVWSHMMKSVRIDERSSESVPATESTEEIASAVHVIHKSCKVDSHVVEGWFRKLATVRMDLPVLGGGNDGVTYEVKLEHGMDMMQARIWVSKQQKHLTTLVDRINREIQEASCTEIKRGSKRV